MPMKHTRTPAGEAFRKAVAKLQGAQVQVGWFAKDRYPQGGPPVAYVAAIQEYGTDKIPARPYMRVSAERYNKDWKSNFGKGATAILKGQMAIDQVLNIVGEGIAGDIRKQIAATNSPPLSPVTLMLRKMKRKDQTLKITGVTVGEAARRVAAGESVDGVPTDPLRNTTLMISTLTHMVEVKK